MNSPHPNPPDTVAALPRGHLARITHIDDQDPDAALRLREMGFCEGDCVEVLHFGAWGRSPIYVRLHRTFIAMRPNEAALIKVESVSLSETSR